MCKGTLCLTCSVPGQPGSFLQSCIPGGQPQYPLVHEVIPPQGQDFCSSLCDTSLDSCWRISPPCQGPPQSCTTPRFQLFAKLFVSSSKLLMKLWNYTGSCTNLWSTPLVTGSCASHWNSLCWSQPFDPSSSAISFQFALRMLWESVQKALLNSGQIALTIVPSSPSHSSPLKGYWASQAWFLLHRPMPTTLNHVPVFSYIDLQKYLLHHLPRDWDEEDPLLVLQSLLLILLQVSCPIQQQDLLFLLLLTGL